MNIRYDSEMLAVEQAGSSNFRDVTKEKGIRKNNFDAVIATGNDQSAKYFNYYFKKSNNEHYTSYHCRISGSYK